MTPQISKGFEGSETYEYREPSLTYKVGDERVAGKVDGMESVKQAIRHILSTERYSQTIYDGDYGVELEQYIGKDLGTIRAGVEDTLREALMQDDRITDVVVTDVKQSEKQLNSCTVEFTVGTIYGNTEETLNVVQ